MEIKDGKNYIPAVKELITEYLQWLGQDLSFQNVDEELRDPAKKYTSPEGELLVAVENGKVLGMVAYHRHTQSRCEMKRLYVCPEARGLHLGEQLVEKILLHAKAAGYKEIVLDTLVPLKAAVLLYKKCGFTPCEAYYANPLPDVIYMKKVLQT